MKKLLFVLLIFMISCIEDNKEKNIVDKELSIRLIPKKMESIWNDKKDLQLFFAIDSDDVKQIMTEFVENFICDSILDTIKLENYSALTLCFLKETEETKRIVDEGITDSNNPLSSEHFEFLSYMWLNGEFYEKRVNNGKVRVTEFICE